MNVNKRLSPEQQIEDSFNKLNDQERQQMKEAAYGKDEGGDALTGALRVRAVDLGLAYSSGHLRPLAYKLLQRGSLG